MEVYFSILHFVNNFPQIAIPDFRWSDRRVRKDPYRDGRAKLRSGRHELRAGVPYTHCLLQVDGEYALNASEPEGVHNFPECPDSDITHAG